MAVPGVKLSEEDVARRKVEPLLPRTEASEFRSNVMRAAFLAQDRADIGEAVKSLAQFMSKPTMSALADLKHLGRYLAGTQDMCLIYHQQRRPKKLLVSVDSDHGANKFNRKSTTGMVIRLGRHVLKCTSNLQTAIGLNVSESEFYALVHGACNGLGMRSFMIDLGMAPELEIESDSTSAKSFASRKGLGKQRRMQTRFLWIQDHVAMSTFSISKVDGSKNISDVLTKFRSGTLLAKHLAVM